MRLLDELESLAAAEESLFRRQLLSEDLARLHKVRALVRTSPDCAGFIKAGMLLGWTQGDARTHELLEPLTHLLEAIYAFEQGRHDAAQEAHIVACWQRLHQVRMERLLGCLSTRPPKPDD